MDLWFRPCRRHRLDCVYRYSIPPTDYNEPKQTAGNVKLESPGPIPILLVAVLFVMSIRTARAVDGPVTREADIIVTGHQWWWEFVYPSVSAITANEIHLPVGRDMLIAIQSRTMPLWDISCAGCTTSARQPWCCCWVFI